MDLNATFIGQIIVFLILLGFIWKVVVPMIAVPVAERQKKIAAGLAAAEQGQKDLEEAKGRADALVREARDRARQIEDQAARRAAEAVDAAKQTAHNEGARIVAAARTDVGNEAIRARDELRRTVGALVVRGTAQLLEREVDAKAHAQLLDRLAEDIARV